MIETVAVIGGSGFVGRAAIEKLAHAGKQIIVLCRNSDRAKFLKPIGRVGQITIVAGDAMDEAALGEVSSNLADGISLDISRINGIGTTPGFGRAGQSL